MLDEAALLVDILAPTLTELTGVLAATLRWLDEQRHRRESTWPDVLKAMEIPLLRPAFNALGFIPVDYSHNDRRFAFMCAALDRTLSTTITIPERWYITPSD